MPKKPNPRAEAQRAADRAVKQAQLELERALLSDDLSDIGRRRAKLARKMALAARLRRKFKR